MAAEIRRPDFLVAGAPKCGTTALHAYLRAQPEVFVPAAREPNFFSTDVATRKRLSQTEYLRLFRGAGGARRVGEVSVWYLYSRRAARAIRDFCGPVQIIAILRNPIDAMHSLHSQLVTNGDEHLRDFGQALAAEPERARGEGVRKGAWLGPECFCYRRVYRYLEQIERYIDTFGRERLHVVVFDDLVRDPAAAGAGVLAFLGIDDPVGEIGWLNRNKEVRRPWLRALHRRIDRPARRAARRLIPSGRLRGRIGRRLVGGLKGLYTATRERPAMSPELRRRLAAELAPEVRELGDLIGRDLGTWLETPA